MLMHPLAQVSPKACIAEDVQIGPFCVIEPDVMIGQGCILEARVTVKSGTTLGSQNHIFEGAVIGGMPQHVHMPENPGRVDVGNGNVLRENVTIHRALEAGHSTTVGDHCLLMVNAHVAHDCRLGDQVIMTANALLAGHVIVGDRAYLSGAAAVHQFCHVGSLAMVGGQAHIVKDVPPFVTVDGLSSYVVGLNSVGLRRAGFAPGVRQRLKDAYRVIYRSGLAWAEILHRLKTEFTEEPAAEFYRCLAIATRGIVCERRTPPGATIKIRQEAEDEPELRISKAG